MEFPSLAATQVIKMTTFNAATDETFRQKDNIFISVQVVRALATTVGDEGVSEVLGPRFQTAWFQLMKQIIW